MRIERKRCLLGHSSDLTGVSSVLLGLKWGISTLQCILFCFLPYAREAESFTTFLSKVLTSTKKEVKLQLVETYGKNVLQLQYWFQGKLS